MFDQTKIIILTSFFVLTWQATIMNRQHNYVKLTPKYEFRGVTYTFNQTINTLFKYEQLVYAFDISILRRVIEESHSEINKFCANESENYSNSLQKRLRDIKTMEYFLDTSDNLDKIIIIDTFSELNTLKSNLNTYLNSSNTEKCLIFKNLTDNFQKVYSYIEKFGMADFSFIDEVVEFKKFHHDIKKAISKYYLRNISFPLDFDEGYGEEFFASVRMKLQSHNETLFLKLFVPIFEKKDLFKLTLTPFVCENYICKLKKEADFVAFNGTIPISFSTNDIENLCYPFNKELYCREPITKFNCNSKYLTFNGLDNNVSKMCFELTRILPQDKQCEKFMNIFIIMITLLFGMMLFAFLKKIHELRIELKKALYNTNTYARASDV